jgi:hypothetical protein
MIVLSMDLVRYLTKFSGFLTVKSNETKQYQNFDPTSFCVPNVDWVPPYPYRLVDVLFPVEYQQFDHLIAFPFHDTFIHKTETQVLSDELMTNDSLGG